jgi:hypothetical protein
MTLGREDVHLIAGHAPFRGSDADRKLRDAALLAWTIRNARQLKSTPQLSVTIPRTVRVVANSRTILASAGDET